MAATAPESSQDRFSNSGSLAKFTVVRGALSWLSRLVRREKRKCAACAGNDVDDLFQTPLTFADLALVSNLSFWECGIIGERSGFVCRFVSSRLC